MARFILRPGDPASCQVDTHTHTHSTCAASTAQRYRGVKTTIGHTPAHLTSPALVGHQPPPSAASMGTRPHSRAANAFAPRSPLDFPSLFDEESFPFLESGLFFPLKSRRSLRVALFSSLVQIRRGKKSESIAVCTIGASSRIPISSGSLTLCERESRERASGLPWPRDYTRGSIRDETGPRRGVLRRQH